MLRSQRLKKPDYAAALSNSPGAAACPMAGAGKNFRQNKNHVADDSCVDRAQHSSHRIVLMAYRWLCSAHAQLMARLLPQSGPGGSELHRGAQAIRCPASQVPPTPLAAGLAETPGAEAGRPPAAPWRAQPVWQSKFQYNVWQWQTPTGMHLRISFRAMALREGEGAK